MRYPARQEVWLVDFGMAGKVRPCVVFSTSIGDLDRALVTVVPHTTAMRGTEYEAQLDIFFLKRGAFNAQGLQTVEVNRAMRLLGVLKDEQMRQVERVVCKWLSLPCSFISS